MLFDAPKTAGLVGLLAGAAKAQYVLDSFYDANNFFNEFSFYSDEDPTHGYVNYVDGDTAFGMNLASADDNVVRVGADSTESNPDGGRKSVRMESNNVFNHGLIIGDFTHMPASVCGTWPAFWMFGPNWPNSGEIDIIEGVNNDDATAVTLHTGPGCVISNEGTDPATELKETDCNAGNAFTGCGQQTFNPLNYGDGFNSNEGGVYATEWTSEFIAVWFFPRGSIPQDINDQNPNPSSWGFPIAKFVGTGCDIDSIFRDHKIIINTTFCGDWAGNVWDSNEICKARAPTCTDFVGNNPQEFEEAYWAINNIAIYQNTGAPNGTITSRGFNA